MHKMWVYSTVTWMLLKLHTLHLTSKGKVADKIWGEESCSVCSVFSLVIRMELFWVNTGILYDRGIFTIFSFLRQSHTVHHKLASNLWSLCLRSYVKITSMQYCAWLKHFKERLRQVLGRWLSWWSAYHTSMNTWVCIPATLLKKLDVSVHVIVPLLGQEEGRWDMGDARWEWETGEAKTDVSLNLIG